MKFGATIKKARQKLGSIRDEIRKIIPERRHQNRKSHVDTTLPSPPAVNRVPAIAAIHGNEQIKDIWGPEGVPGRGTLKTCNDGGTELQLQTSDDAARKDVPTGPMAFFQLGSQFGEHRAEDLPPAIDESDTDPEPIAKRRLREIDQELRRVSRNAFDGPQFYIPIDSLYSIITRDAIREILPGITAGVVPDLLDQLAQDIYGRLVDDDRQAKSFRKILAILILIGKADSILDFLKGDISDYKLHMVQLGDDLFFELGSSKLEEPKAIPLFKKWERRHIEEFEKAQWDTLAPFFSRGTKEQSLVRHYKLLWRHPLPFDVIPEELIPEDKCVGSGANKIAASSGATSSGSQSSLGTTMGGNSKVCKVRIHPAHNNLQCYKGMNQNPALAIKRLWSADRDAFKNEVNILTRLNKSNDPHLVKLLLTMEIADRSGVDSSFFLIFPLADGNLREFWQQKFPHPPRTNMATYARWVAKQFHGLECALCKLHDLHEREIQSLRDGEDDGNNASGDPLYGIHGDIKPENLLWYEEWVGPSGAQVPTVNNLPDTKDPFGVLQLADFGISSLHRLETRSNNNMRKLTKTYAPPEAEWGVYKGSRSFDIWSLGCVFLEFICWLVQGSSGDRNPVDVFHDARYLEIGGQKTNRSLEGTFQDTFYHIMEVEGGASTKFVINPAVTELVKTLKKSPESSAFVNDMLDIILYEMLVVEPRAPKAIVNNPNKTSPSNKRIECLNLVSKLKVMVWNGREDDYLTKPGPATPDSVPKDPQAVTIPESATALANSRRSITKTFPLDRSKAERLRNGRTDRASTIHEIPSPSP